jgi:hypothetical protein
MRSPFVQTTTVMWNVLLLQGMQDPVLATWIIRFKKCQSQRPFCCVKFPRKSTSSSEMAITTRLSYTRLVSMQIAC